MPKTRKHSAQGIALRGQTYPSVNALLRGTMPAKDANVVIDIMQDQLTRENLMLSTALQALVEDVTADSPSTVCCADRKVRDRARRVLKRCGAWVERTNP